MFWRHQKIYMNEVERQIRLDEKQKPNSNTSCKESCKKKQKKNWSLSNKEILHQRLLRRVLIRTLDFGIDFAIWSNLEDNYGCTWYKRKNRARRGEIGEKNVTQEIRKLNSNLTVYLRVQRKQQPTDQRSWKRKKSRIKIKAQGNKLETWPVFIIMNFIIKLL